MNNNEPALVSLTKREFFAAMVLQSGNWAIEREGFPRTYKEVAEVCICMADALIKALSKTPEEKHG